MPDTQHAKFAPHLTTQTLPPIASGTARTLSVLRFGKAGSGPKAYLQAGLHADELPGMLALREVALQLADLDQKRQIRGEIIVVPGANPIGLAQQGFGVLQGRYERNSAGNFNRDYPDLGTAAAETIGEKLGSDAAQNVTMIRAAMGAALSQTTPQGELASLRHMLLSLSHDADIVLDLHSDNQAMMHLYTGPRLWPGMADLAADIDARAVLLADISGGNPFDEANSGPWWTLADQFPDAAIPPACQAATLELRSNNQVTAELIADDAAALIRFLTRRGLIDAEIPPLPRLLCEAAPLTAMQQLIAPTAGIVVYHAQLGDRVRTGDMIADIIDPLSGSTTIHARTDGLLFARHDQPYAWPGKVIGKIAGQTDLPERRGKLLTD